MLHEAEPDWRLSEPLLPGWGVYHAISTAYLQNYLDEFSFRYNRRDGREPMFWAMLGRVERRRLAARPLGS